MVVARLFEERPLEIAGRRAALAAAGVTSGLVRGGSAAASDAIPVPAALAALVPGGVRRGEAVALADASAAAAGTATVDYLTLALLAEALRQGLWCAAVGAKALGGAALAGLLGAAALREGALRRLLVVAEPGERWAEVAAVLADGVDLVLVCPPGAVSAQVARRVDARLRQGAADEAKHRAALLVLGSWPSARTVLRVRRIGWSGLGEGVGRLVGGRAEVAAEDRTRRVRTVQVWLPGPDGAVASSGWGERSGQDAWNGRQGGEQGEEAGSRRLTAVA